MNIPQLLEKYRKIDLHEMADNDRVGLEVCTENIPDAKLPLNTVQDKIKWMINYIETTDRNNLRGYKISNIHNIVFKNDFTNDITTYSITLCIGDTDKHNKVIHSNHGLYHMKYGASQHWDATKRCLLNIDKMLTGTLQYIYRNKVQQTDKVNIINHKNKYVIGLAGNPIKNATVLITCYTT